MESHLLGVIQTQAFQSTNPQTTIQHRSAKLRRRSAQRNRTAIHRISSISSLIPSAIYEPPYRQHMKTLKLRIPNHSRSRPCKPLAIPTRTPYIDCRFFAAACKGTKSAGKTGSSDRHCDNVEREDEQENSEDKREVHVCDREWGSFGASMFGFGAW